MSYNGSGTFNINTAGQPVVTGTVISSTAFNDLTADLATGLSTAITKDGQTATTARVPFAQGISSTLTTDATSTTTGSIITAGGISAQKTVVVGTLLDISAGTAGQIKFPATQNASADANTLDDYEEGTWSSGVSFGGGTTGITYNNQDGTYTKIGRQVTCWFFVRLTNKGSSTGDAKLTGLPFTISTANAQFGVSAGNLSIEGMSSITGGVNLDNFNTGSSVTTLDFSTGNVTATYAALTDANFTNTSQAATCFTYNA